MKDLCGEIRNACMSIRLVERHMPNSPDKVLLRRQVRRIESALTKYQAQNEPKTKPE